MSEAQLTTLFGGVTVVEALLWFFAGIALIVLLVKAWPKIRRFVQTVDALSGLPEFMAEIHHEVRTNHGSSLKDAVNRVEKKLDDHVEKCGRKCEAGCAGE